MGTMTIDGRRVQFTDEPNILTVIRKAGIDIPTLIKYAMSLDGPDAVCIGMDSHAIVQSNLDILRNFKKYSAAEMKELSKALGPF